MDLQGANAVVTGGSQGIGADIAAKLAEAGANVLVAARSTAKLEEVAGRIGGKFLTVDLTDADSVDSFIPKCRDELGSIDVLVNNAGLETDNAFTDMDPSVLRSVARLNYEAPLILTRAVLPEMLDRGSGHIVNISSVAGAIVFPGLAAYAGTKAGLTNWSETLRMELKGSGIGITVVCPGPVDTDMWDRLETGEGNYPAPALKRFKILGFLPKLDPEKIAEETVEGILSDKRHVRLPARYNGYHFLNNAPRRMVEAAMLGVKLPRVG